MSDQGNEGDAPYDVDWDAERVRDLRARLGLTQAGLADRLGTRQQTVSEWETGTSSPRRMSRRLLRMVAEDAGLYDAGPPTPSAATSAYDASSRADVADEPSEMSE